ncbi:glycosyltransferase family 2 protein [Brucepastera parasyntrophica]|uniref:glycosyltransferase family 2 protein n=1 Tax=Brucepastera parasyntrophica TaxID=2880008 RepID=UPI00210F228F|nr:glycosyltransferase family 2 protein [Brucepastera parasyntrophica]ULQ60044.1 glycosyltransferase family 2 protein [Brucepastera parasyntrophica]
MEYDKMKILIAVPALNEENNVTVFYQAVQKEAARIHDIELHIIFIDDGSTDNTLAEIKQLCLTDSKIHYISFSRNFGKEAAIYAGLEYASEENYDYVIISDIDLQDPPSLIPEMIAEIITGEYDCIAARRVTRKGEPVIRSFFARQFYSVIRKLCEIDIADGARDFRIMTIQMARSLLSLKEKNRFSKGLFVWIGYKTKYLEYENIKRKSGETKWSFWKLCTYAIDGIIAFTTVPLYIAAICGILFCFISFLIIIYIIIKTLVFGDPVAGWPSTICIILMLGGIQLFSIGILGLYLSKTYIETKQRPLFIIREKK